MLGLILPGALPLMGFRGRAAEKDPTPTLSWEFGQTLDPVGSEATGKEWGWGEGCVLSRSVVSDSLPPHGL